MDLLNALIFVQVTNEYTIFRAMNATEEYILKLWEISFKTQTYLASRACLRELLLINLILEADVLLETLDIVLEIDTLKRLLLEMFPGIVQKSLQSLDFLFQFTLPFPELLALGLRLIVLRL